MMADILGGVLEVAANIAITAVATAAVVAATGITVATGGLGCFLLGAVVGTIVGLAMSKSGADKGLTKICDAFSNALFPPTVQANILTGSTNTLTNNIPPPARQGRSAPMSHRPAPSWKKPSLSQSPVTWTWPKASSRRCGAPPSQRPRQAPCRSRWTWSCMKHPPMPPQFLAEGSEKVTINGQPAVRSGDRSTCDATVVSSGLISSNVAIGGGSVVVREIRSGKTPGLGWRSRRC